MRRQRRAISGRWHIGAKVLGPDHLAMATVVRNYIVLLQATNRHAKAAQLEAQWQAKRPPHP